MVISPIFNQSLTSNAFQTLRVEGASVASAKTVTDIRSIVIADGSGAGSITTQYGLYIGPLTKGASNYAIYTGAGSNRLGDQLSIVGSSASRVQLVVYGASGQSVDLQDWNDSSGSRLAYVSLYGDLVGRSTQITGSPVSVAPNSIAFTNVTSGTPTNPTTPAGWITIVVNGNARYVPFYS